MNETQAKQQKERLDTFETLKRRRRDVYSTIKEITEDWEHGPSGQGPFTENTRESRDVLSIELRFSPTKGFSPQVTLSLENLNIPAPAFKKFLLSHLEPRLKAIDEEIENL